MQTKDIILVDVDTQRDFLDESGALYVPGSASLVPKLGDLVAWAGRNGVPVLSSKDTHAPDDKEFDQFPQHCIRDTDGWAKVPGTTLAGAVTPEGRPSAGSPQVILEKSTFDLFSNSTVDRLLEAEPFKGRKAAVVIGVATDYCVRAAALGFARRCFGVCVVEDAVAAVTEDTGKAAIAEMKQAGVEFISSDTVLRLTE